jgi:hypothetical protein
LDSGEQRNLPIRLVKTLVVQSPEEAKRSAERQAQREAERVEAASKASEAKKAETKVGSGKLSVVVKTGWGEVYIDGKRIETTPLYNHPLKAGRHRVIVVSGATGERKSRTVTIVPGEATKVSF